MLEKDKQSLYDKVANLDIRLSRLEVGTEERHKASEDKHQALIDSLKGVKEEMKWFSRLLIASFLGIVTTVITVVMKGGA